ncbi:MAG: hypothetical protein JJ975_09290 [Bacteroidia bacterium]|nr:hypothetical protein [Bacteroidia bacterium]
MHSEVWSILRPLSKPIKTRLGGSYSLFEKLRLGGVGSPKMSYASGLELFDSMKESRTVLLANFELFKAGLLLWVNSNKDNSGIAYARKDEIDTIFFHQFYLRVKDDEDLDMANFGLIDVHTTTGQRVSVFTDHFNYKRARKFFAKDWLAEKTEFRNKVINDIKEYDPGAVSFWRLLMASFNVHQEDMK